MTARLYLVNLEDLVRQLLTFSRVSKEEGGVRQAIKGKYKNKYTYLVGSLSSVLTVPFLVRTSL